MKIFFEPAGDGMSACIRNEDGAIICEAKYDDFEEDTSKPEKIMQKLVELYNKENSNG